MPDTRICVFLKPPLAGKAKTRLIPAVGAEGAAALAGAFFRDTWNSVEALSWALPVVASTDSLGPEVLPQPDTPVWLQGGGDLGARIERILKRALTQAPMAMALGADSPGIPTSFLERAHEAMRSADAVLGPCEDGGFYLLGVHECPAGLLAGIPWSQSTTFTCTLERLRERGLKVTVLDLWYDIDRPEDLEHLLAQIASGETTAPYTGRVLTSLRATTTSGSPVPFSAQPLDAKEGGSRIP
jgi:rSAM/selenodomain-associated transferase 1